MFENQIKRKFNFSPKFPKILTDVSFYHIFCIHWMLIDIWVSFNPTLHGDPFRISEVEYAQGSAYGKWVL